MAKAHNLLVRAAAHLKKNGIDEAALNAQWLLASAMGIGRLELMACSSVKVPAAAQKGFEKNLALKTRGLPLAYILGEQNFCGLKLKLDKSVLVPRPETEELVELVSASIRKRLDSMPAAPARKISVLDFGTGSGAIALALAARFGELRVTAVDRSRRALVCARKNAVLLGLQDRVSFLNADSLARTPGKYDIIVSNPPYIPTQAVAGLEVEVQFEPKIALDGGADGLKIMRRLISEAPYSLEKAGELFIESGAGQWRAVTGLFLNGSWSENHVSKDLNGRERFILLRRKP